MSAAHPVYDKDLFAPEALRHPFAHYRAIRDLGPAVWLPKTEVYAIGRFADVRNALRAADALVSGKGVGFNAVFNAPRDHPPVIGRDGADHKRLRLALIRPLTPVALKAHRALLKELIAARLDTLVGQGEFDAMPAIAQHLPLTAIANLVGLKDADREKMLSWAAASFNAIGPLALDGSDDPKLVEDIATAMDVRNYLLQIDPRELKPGSWASTLFEAVADGRMTAPDAGGALAGFVLPSLDTTIYATGSLLYNLGMNPDQWRKLREDPSLIPAAVLESMRFSPVVRWFSRVAAEDYVQDGLHIPAGGRVMILYGAANRDERHYPDPDRFDVTRNPVDQLGWGTGPHMCAGAYLAAMEMELVLEAMVERARSIEVGRPVLGANRGLYGIERLPLRLV